jgi:hypothetical protein
MPNDIAPRRGSLNLPDYLRGQTKTERIGNYDRSDLVIPRIKLLAMVSPEVEEYENAKAGEFWHTTLKESMGKELVGIPLVLRKTHVLWAPRGDERGILARSRDGIRWDPPEGEFQVKFKGNPRTYTWRLKPTVAESGLDQFGSQRDDDPNSPPAAALTYEILWLFPDRMDLGPSIILNSRGSAKACQDLLSMVDAKPVDHFFQLYLISSVVAKGPEGTTYHNYRYTGLGYADESDGEVARSMFLQYKDIAFRANDERTGDDAPSNGGRSAAPVHRDEHTKF